MDWAEECVELKVPALQCRANYNNKQNKEVDMPKFNELVSKIFIQGNASDSIAKDILDWCKDSMPKVIVRGKKNKTISKKKTRIGGNK